MNLFDELLAEAEQDTRAAIKREAREAGKIIRRDLHRGRRNLRRGLEDGDLSAFLLGSVLSIARRVSQHHEEELRRQHADQLQYESTRRAQYESARRDPPRPSTKVPVPPERPGATQGTGKLPSDKIIDVRAVRL